MRTAKRLLQVGTSATLRTSALAAKLRAEGRPIIDFSAGEPDFPTDDDVKDAAKRALDEDRTRYTHNAGMLELRQAIAAKLERENGLRYDPAAILVSSGAKASIHFALMALLDPGDEVILPSPYWVSYPAQVSMADAVARVVRTEGESDFKLNAADLDRGVGTRTRVLILNYPSNPTGACYTRDELAALGEVVVARDLFVIADEIYERLVYDGFQFASLAALGDELKSRTLVVNGMSKAFSMTGWRVGYAAGPREWISAMARYQSHATSNANSIAQWASLQALGSDGSAVDRRREAFQRRRDEMHAALAGIDGVRCTLPSGAFYLFPDVSGLFGRRAGGSVIGCGEDLSRFLLEEASVAVVPGEAFGSEKHVRFSFAASLDAVREGMKRVADAIGRLR